LEKMTDRVAGPLCGLLVLVLLTSCSGQNGSNRGNTGLTESGQAPEGQAVLSFDTLSHDFGTILEGERVVGYFDYVNTGSGDLVISAVEATCGCTTPGWDSEPIGPGDSGVLKVIFDSSGRSGNQHKAINVTSNAKNSRVRLTITANIIEN